MTSAPVRDPLADHLITLQNAALLLIDYQPAQLAGVWSMDRALLVKNAVSTVSGRTNTERMVIAPAINTGTFGVAPQDAGVAAAAVSVGQMLGGSVGTSPLNTIFASAVASYLTANLALAGSSAARP
jgi:hypothetical protein